MNMDVTMRDYGSFLAMVSRNDRAEVLHVHSFKSDMSIPEVVQLEAILRAMQIALSFGLEKCIF